jgi:hypothetical protein
MPTTSKSFGRSAIMRKTNRPIRPNPLIPTRIATVMLLCVTNADHVRRIFNPSDNTWQDGLGNPSYDGWRLSFCGKPRIIPVLFSSV